MANADHWLWVVKEHTANNYRYILSHDNLLLIIKLNEFATYVAQ